MPDDAVRSRPARRPHAQDVPSRRLDNSYETELRKLIAVDLLIVDDFGLDAMDPTESRDAYEIMTERHRSGSMIVRSNRGLDEWLATFADPIRAQAVVASSPR